LAEGDTFLLCKTLGVSMNDVGISTLSVLMIQDIGL
jgi:hypothetical protein